MKGMGAVMLKTSSRTFVLSVMLLASVFATNSLAEETWGQWSWKWGTRAAGGAAAAAVVVCTLPVSGPVLACAAGAAAAGGAAVVSHCQGDEKARDNFIIGGAAFTSGAIVISNAPAAAAAASKSGAVKTAISSGAETASNLAKAITGNAVTQNLSYIFSAMTVYSTATSETPEDALKSTRDTAIFSVISNKISDMIFKKK